MGHWLGCSEVDGDLEALILGGVERFCEDRVLVGEKLDMCNSSTQDIDTVALGGDLLEMLWGEQASKVVDQL